ncbi:MAG: hypothetical protein OEZ34_08780 [Spirochaetia bacterium]|nr:hypothetical protein [Spirochaetia bacterium]
MKKAAISLILLMFTSVSLFAQEKNDALLFQLLKNIFEQKHRYAYALRVYQYTATTLADNPYSYVLSSADSEKLAGEASLTLKDKGKYTAAIKNRNPARIKKLWIRHKKYIFQNFSNKDYDNLYLSYKVDGYLETKTSTEYSKKMAILNKECPKLPCPKLLSKAYSIGHAPNLLFWFRREKEKNHDVVFEILKEIQAHYKNQPAGKESK